MRLTATHLPPLMLLLLLLSSAPPPLGVAAGSAEKQTLDPGGGAAGPTTVPAFPVAQARNQTCRLDLSAELFGGVAEACGRGLDRGRCCPVLAAWLFAAHARSALELPAAADEAEGEEAGLLRPAMPDDSQRCVDALQSSLRGRGVELARPNATCDAVLCFCGIRLHQIGSLTCPAAFNVSGAGGGAARNATPTAAVRELERNCRNASYAGCTRCLRSLDKLKGGDAVGGSGGGNGDRASRMFGRDCQLMGLTWLLARNKTAYIPTVSAVLRAMLYSAHPPSAADGQQYRCSPDQENMPLAVDSLQFEKLDSAAAPSGLMLNSITILLSGVAAHLVL